MSQLDAKDLLILELEQLVREQEQRIGELETLVRELMTQNSKQLERLKSYSQTSSKPPSTDSLVPNAGGEDLFDVAGARREPSIGQLGKKPERREGVDVLSARRAGLDQQQERARAARVRGSSQAKLRLKERARLKAHGAGVDGDADLSAARQVVTGLSDPGHLRISTRITASTSLLSLAPPQLNVYQMRLTAQEMDGK